MTFNNYFKFSQQAKNNPNFKLFEDRTTTGIGNLDPMMTINGTTYQPVYRYKGEDAGLTNWPAWTYGRTLGVYRPTSTASFYNEPTPFNGPYNTCIKFNGGPDGANNGRVYTASLTEDNMFGGVKYEDFVCEFVVSNYHGGAGAFERTIFQKYGTTNTSGYILGNGGIVPSRFILRSGSTTMILDGANALKYSGRDYHWFHGMVFYDKSGTSTYYINGQEVETNATPFSGSLSENSQGIPFSIGARYTVGLTATNSHFLYASLYTGSNWLDTSIQKGIAASRFYALTGIKPSKGSVSNISYIRTGTSSTVKTLPDGTKRLFKLGAHFPRLTDEEDALSSSITGIKLESPIYNLCRSTEDFDHPVLWNVYTTGIVSPRTGSEVGPDGISGSAWLITENLSSSFHQLGYSDSATFSNLETNKRLFFSVFAKAGTCNNIWLGGDISSSAMPGAFFNLASGTYNLITDVPAGAHAGMYSFGNGWWRCWVTSYPNMTGSWVAAIGMAQPDESRIYTGTGRTFSVYGFNVQNAVSASSHLLSYTHDSASYNSPVTSGDALLFSGAGAVSQGQEGAFACKVLYPSYDITDNAYIAALYKTASINLDNMAMMVTSSASDVLKLSGATTSGGELLITGSARITNNIIHNIDFSWIANRVNARVDQVDQGTDTAYTPFSGANALGIGHFSTKGNELNAIISNIKTWQRRGK